MEGSHSETAARREAGLGSLSGLKVLDLSRVLAGPWASQILGDLGAEVWKIERPSAGDDTRTWGPPFLQGAGGVSDAAYYLCTNRNKHSVAIDFAKPEGAEIVKRMAASADIVIENFKTGALARYGLDYPSLSAINPRLIYCSITGFGHTGPYAMRGRLRLPHSGHERTDERDRDGRMASPAPGRPKWACRSAISSLASTPPPRSWPLLIIAMSPERGSISIARCLTVRSPCW